MGGPLLLALVAFVLGAALAGWLVWQGVFADYLPAKSSKAAQTERPAALAAGEGASGEGSAVQIGTIEGRLAMLEDRLSRIDFQADAASGNAARAESLLIAFAARRTIDRGEPLSYVADQLRLRFADAQPRAVQTIIDFAKAPVTIDELNARLEALSPRLTTGAGPARLWDRARRELSSLFIVHRDSSALLTPTARIERARLMLTSRRVGQAIAEVRRLPNIEAAEQWIADATRYQQAQQALDLIETSAMLEPRGIRDASGQEVDQPSPLATPAQGSSQDAEPTASPSPGPR
jgi:hypothetical protein